MVKKKKEETIQDIMDRIQEDLDILRDKAQDLEDNQCQCDSDSDSDEDSDWDDDVDEDEEDSE
jgi:hypothetical protein